MMGMVAAVVAMSALKPVSLVLVDPYQAYQFDCFLHRPNGESLKVYGNVFGRSDETRRATIAGSDRRLPYGQNVSVYREKPKQPEFPVEFETISFDRHGSDFRYIIDQSMPLEKGFVRMTIIQVKLLDLEPIKFSALGYCKKTDVYESETVQ